MSNVKTTLNKQNIKYEINKCKKKFVVQIKSRKMYILFLLQYI